MANLSHNTLWHHGTLALVRPDTLVKSCHTSKISEYALQSESSGCWVAAQTVARCLYIVSEGSTWCGTHLCYCFDCFFGCMCLILEGAARSSTSRDIQLKCSLLEKCITNTTLPILCSETVHVTYRINVWEIHLLQHSLYLSQIRL